MKMKENLVSAIIPTFNRMDYISKALDSVLSQSYKNIEIIVIDDGSTDNTIEFLKNKYANKVKVLQQAHKGPGSARNTGILHSQGEYIAFLDSDDWWNPRKIEFQIDLMITDLEIGLVYCDMEYFFNGNTLNKFSFDIVKPLNGQCAKEIFLYGSPMHTPTSLVRRSAINNVGFFDEALNNMEDQDLWFRLSCKYKIDYIDISLVGCERNNSNKNRPTHNINIMIVKERMINKNGIQYSNSDLRKGMKDVYLKASYTYLKMGDKNNAKNCFKKHFELFPFSIKGYIVWIFSKVSTRTLVFIKNLLFSIRCKINSI